MGIGGWALDTHSVLVCYVLDSAIDTNMLPCNHLQRQYFILQVVRKSCHLLYISSFAGLCAVRVVQHTVKREWLF